jgi:predicted RNA-binding protein YlxR (DUF448 family)
MMPRTKSDKRGPQRTCVACREVKDKREMVRIVRLPDGKVSIDPSGRLSGRGAYVCSSPGCWKVCFSGNQLDHVLKIKIAPDERDRLLAEARSLMGGD